jgi:hypothetical protein
MIHGKALFILFFFFSGGDNWELKKNTDNIAVFTRNSAASSYKELRCMSKVKTSLSAVVKMLTDVDQYPRWVFHCSEAGIVKKVNDADYYYYERISAPFPVSDRDMVAHLKITQDSKSKTVTVTSDVTQGFVPEKNGIVRIKKFHSTYTIIPKEKGMTEIDSELGTEPGGNVPAWLVNMAIVKGPFSTQQMMNKLLQTSIYKTAKLNFITEP